VTTSTLPALPRILNASHAEALKRTWEELERLDLDRVDAAGVQGLDSAGLQLLLDALDERANAGRPVTLVEAAPCLRAARKAFRLGDRMPFDEELPEDEVPPTPLGIRLGELLVGLGHVAPEQLERALGIHRNRPDTYLGQILIEEGFLTEETLARTLGVQHGLPYLDPVAEGLLDVTICDAVPFTDLRVYGVLPFLRLDGILAVALQDPADVYATDVVRSHTGLAVIPSVATPSAIQAGLDQIQRALAGKGAAKVEAPLNEEVSAAERFESLLVNAIIEGASDIHLEPFEGYYLLRYRVDGRLHEVERMEAETGHSLTARIKVMAGCDISEKRLPQDGRIHYEDQQRDVDLRVNTLPTVFGEKTVMRILDRSSKALTLEQLGLRAQALAWLREGVTAPHGMVLVTGPTGSGKTTTLYSVLDEIVSPEINVCTVENPVERTVPGVIQTQVNPKAGLSFAASLRSLLRQDPDVVMIGEIRDRETAQIAIEAAQTGHLVLATLHTNDAPGAATRLIQMGVEPFLVAATLRTVMAQRLVRKLCDACKQPATLPPEVVRRYVDDGLAPEGTVHRAVGCPSCRDTGYDGRRGVFEVMRVDTDLQDLIGANPSSVEVRRRALESGMVPLLSDALDRVNRGITTLEEALRAAGNGS